MCYNWYNDYDNETLQWSFDQGHLTKESVDSGFGSGVAFLKQRTVEYLFW